MQNLSSRTVTRAGLLSFSWLALALTSCDQEQDNSEAGQKESKEPAAVNDSPPPALPATSPVPVPELGKKNFIAALQDAYDRIDPMKDGWESEAFNSSAMEQLHRLEAELARADLNLKALEEIAVESVVTTELRPEKLETVYTGSRLKVRRWSSQIPLTPSQNQSGREVLASELARLQSAGTKIESHLKIVRVNRESDTQVRTRVLVDLAAESQEARRQINATWDCLWLTSPDRLPLLSSIRLEKYEEIEQGDHSNTLFSDITAAVLSKNSSYQQQFLTQTDHWRARLPRALGLDAVANHGLAIGDINGDELDDLYICQQGGLPNRLFLQEPDGSLRDITEQSGTGWLDYCASALLLDLDNDGDRDLLISQDFRILAMENDGAGNFTLAFGASTKAQSFSLAAADYDNNGLVDFYICGYNPSSSEIRAGAMGEPMPFHDANNGGPNMLWHNDGNWKFSDLTTQSGLAQNNTRFTFAATWEDYDNDGDQDLYVANDYGRNSLYRNDGGKFTDVAPELGVEDTSSGMAVSWSDFNHDGYMDLYTSNMFSSAGNRITYQQQFKKDVSEEVRKEFQHIATGNSLFQAVPGGAFKDVGVSASVSMGRWAWGSRFVDFNNDGLDDILVANGFISTEDTGDL